MKESNSDETFFREIMSKSKLDVPFSDFEDNVMSFIKRQSLKRESISKDIKLSWLFFILGSTFGITISIILPRFIDSILGIPVDKFLIPFIIIISLLLLTQIDTLLKFYNKQIPNRKRFDSNFS
jgi:hypothetical protein